jgi:excisionase family DNA binding protein
MATKRPDRRGHTAPRPSVTKAEDVYTVKEAATHLKVSLRKVKYLLADGELGSIRSGRRRLIRASDIQAYLDSAGVRT